MSDQTQEPLLESDRMLREAVEALQAADSSLLKAQLEPYRLPDWSQADPVKDIQSAPGRMTKSSSVAATSIEAAGDSAMQELRIELGKVRMDWEDLYRLPPHALLLLDHSENELVEMFAGDIPLAKGEIVCLDGRICFRVLELFVREDDQR